MKNGFVVTVQAFVESNSADEATDAIGEMIRPCDTAQGGAILDWCVTGDRIPISVPDSMAGQEGAVWIMLDRYRDQKKSPLDQGLPRKRDLYVALKEFIDFAACRQSNAAERKALAERFEALGNKFRPLLRTEDRRGM